MQKTITREWVVAALIRAIRTIAQTAVGMLAVGAALEDIQWMRLLSVSIMAGLISLLTSVATGLPEVGSDGDLIVTSTDNKDTFRVALDNQGDPLKDRKKVTFVVKNEPEK